MFKALLKVRLASLKSSFLGRNRSKNKPSTGKTVGYAVLLLYVIGIFGFMFFQIFSAIAEVFYIAGIGWLYFTMFAMLSFAMMFIFSVFTAKSQLFEAKDNDLLLSMPIPPRMILSSRMLSLYILNLLSGLVVAIPAAIAWLAFCRASVMGAVSFVLLLLVLPLFSTAFAALFGWLLSLVTSRLRNKSLVSTILSLVFLVAYFYGYNKVNSVITSLVTNGGIVAEKLSSAAPLYWIGSAVSDGNVLNLLLSLVCLVLPFVIACAILSATFIHTATSKRGAAKIAYREREQKVSSASSALYRREMGRFLSSSIYIMNAGLGALFLAAAAVFLVIKQSAVLDFAGKVPGFGLILFPGVLLAECLLSGTILISAPSISLEGKNLWIVKSLPVSAWQVIRSKVCVHLTVALPAALLAEIATVIVFRPSGFMLLIALLQPLLFNVFAALVGVTANLKHPNFDWTNEAQPIKGSISLLLTMLVTFTAVVVPAIVGYLLVSTELQVTIAAALYTLLIAAICLVVYKWLKTKGAAVFAKL